MNPLAALEEWPVSRAAAAVLSRDGVLATFGKASEPFRLASVTKPLAALATLVAVEEGALELDDPAPDDLAGATVAHLLAHASGIAGQRRLRIAEPGSRRIYSNAGFEVLAELVEAATGMTFADYLGESVFTPLGMTGASLPGSPASGGLASVDDIAAVMARLLAPSSGFLDPSTISLLTSVQFPGLRGVLPGYGSQPDNDWGLGVEIRGAKSPHWTSPRNSAATYGHFGQSGTMFWIDPVAGVGLVALADRDFDDWAREAWPALSEAVLDSYA